MATEVIMPQMGESIAEGTITRWLVKVGDRVERDQPLFEISTDKVDAEIPSPAAGVLLEIRAEEGAIVPVDEVVAMIGEEGEGAGAGAPEADEKTAPVEEPKAGASKEKESKQGQEQEAHGEPKREPKQEAHEEPKQEPKEEAKEGAKEEAKEEASQAAEGDAVGEAGTDDEAERVRKFSSPVVRKMVEEHGLDLAEIDGSGLHGRVTREDVEKHLAARAKRGEERAEEAPPEAKKDAAPSQDKPARREAGTTEVVTARERPKPEGFYVPPYTEGENVEIVAMSRIRQITSAHMRYSKNTAAHVTTVFHMDLSKVHRTRERAKRAFQEEYGTKLTYMPFLFRAVATALKAHPKLNAAIDGTDIVFKKDINIGMAVALDWGLLVPVIRNADQLNLIGLAKSANDLAERARAKKLSPDELRGGTFTITNPGVYGSLFGTPIINQPQVAILGLGMIEKRPVVESDPEGNDTIVIKPMSYFAITYDHRLVDGADADHFMNHIKRTLVEETWSELDF
jgi:2-oxoglutarate dehydrogenase E2 component (dihydrolipoamide succinyltransferase)